MSRINEQLFRLKAQELYGKVYADLSDEECAEVSRIVADEFKFLGGNNGE